MNYLPREGTNYWGRAYAAGLLVLGGIALYMLLDGDSDGPAGAGAVSVATSVPSATAAGSALAVTGATATPSLSGGEYEVVEGDSAWLIAEKLSVPTGNRDAWVRELLALNDVDELELQVGQTLVLPPIGAGGAGTVLPTAVPEAETPEDDANEDSPAAGDTTATQNDDGEEEAGGDAASDAGEGGGDRDSDDRDLLDLDDLELEDDDGGDSPGVNVQVDSMNIGACATIDDQTYCYGGGGTWSCDRDGDSMRCSGPEGQSTTCSGSGNSITCEAPSGESTTCTVTDNSTNCSSNNGESSSESQSQNCTVLGSATICFGANDD
jgi:hypothetical protein